MGQIESGLVTALYLFDVADAVDLAAVSRLMTVRATRARPALRPSMPAYVQYERPPLIVDGDTIGLPELQDFTLRFTVYDYGVVSVALSRPFAGTWEALIALGQELMENPRLDAAAERACRRFAERLGNSLTSARAAYLAEDYLVFGITRLDERLTADQLLERHGDQMALLLRGEAGGLSGQERDEVLRHRISYLADDLVIPTWNAAVVYDTEAGVGAALEIMEFANSQLLEFRYYDDLLDRELEQIYGDLQRPRRMAVLGRLRHLRAAHRVQSLVIDVNELTDKTENALKIVGDVYAARLYALIAARLGLDQWKQNVAEKLKTLDDIYRFSVDQAQIARGHLLELIIVLILMFELVLFFLGIMR